MKVSYVGTKVARKKNEEREVVIIIYFAGRIC